MKAAWFAFLALCACTVAAHAQQKGTPGQFDFYLLNIVPAAEFCDIKDVGPGCKTPDKPWVLHGLWPQNNDGTYPVFCDERPGPRKPELWLRSTPDLTLIDHEWKKHGTCTTLSPVSFFTDAFIAWLNFKVPAKFRDAHLPVTMKPSEIVAEFARVNASAPPGSIILWCKEGRLTSVSECLSKDHGPTACKGLKSCPDDAPVTYTPAPPAGEPQRRPVKP